MGLLVNDGRLKRGASPLAGIAFYQGPRKPNQNKPLKRPIMRSLAAPFPRRAAASSNPLPELMPEESPVFRHGLGMQSQGLCPPALMHITGQAYFNLLGEYWWIRPQLLNGPGCQPRQ